MKEVDCRGLACPGPVVACSRLVKEEAPSALAVLVDNAAAVENVSRFLRTSGYAVASERREESLWRIRASRDGGSASDAAPQSQPAPSAPRGKTLVLITTETLGRGDDTLGARLMDNFLATLPELGDALWRIVLLNGGVRLAARPGKALRNASAGKKAFVPAVRPAAVRAVEQAGRPSRSRTDPARENSSSTLYGRRFFTFPSF